MIGNKTWFQKRRIHECFGLHEVQCYKDARGLGLIKKNKVGKLNGKDDKNGCTKKKETRRHEGKGGMESLHGVIRGPHLKEQGGIWGLGA